MSSSIVRIPNGDAMQGRARLASPGVVGTSIGTPVRAAAGQHRLQLSAVDWVLTYRRIFCELAEQWLIKFSFLPLPEIANCQRYGNTAPGLTGIREENVDEDEDQHLDGLFR